MKGCNTIFLNRWSLLLPMILLCQPIFAADYAKYISEDYLRSQFTFGAEERLKYSRCVKKSFPTCTYIWGTESSKDAARIGAGLAPDGNKLQIVYAQANSQHDFQRVLTSFTDAEPVIGVGREAIWSSKRSQLSFITDESLIIHINIDEKGMSDAKEKSISIASDLLEQL